MRINTNISAMNAHRQLSINTQNGQKSMEKLSSGLRINRAGDDAAGLAISEKMRGQIRGLTQATRNAQDGISLIQTAEGALNESHSILQRMRELAVQSATDTNTADDRAEIQKEVDQLAAELTRIGDTTEFNTQKLLDGNYQGKFHIGANEGQNMDITIGDMRADALGVSGDGEGIGTFQVTSTAGTDNAALDNVIPDGDNTYKVVDFGETKTVCGATAVMYGLENEDGEIVAVADKEAKEFTFLTGGVKLSELEYKAEFHGAYKDANETIVFGESVRSGEVEVTGAANGVVGDTATTATGTIELEGLATGTYTVDNPADANESYFENINFDGDSAFAAIDLVLLDADGELAAVKFTAQASGNTAGLSDDGSDWIHIDDLDLEGAYEHGATELDVNVLKDGTDAQAIMSTLTLDDGDTLEIKADGGIDVSTQEAADKAITVIDAAISAVSAERSALGANQNRLEHTIANLGTSAENLAAAESRIRDVDMAAEMMEFTKSNILNQASTAMLAQANLAPQNVLQLLG